MQEIKKTELDHTNSHNVEKPKEPYDILKEQIEAGLKEHHRSNVGLFLSSLSAGLEVGFSILMIGIIYTLFKAEVSPINDGISISYWIYFCNHWKV